MNKLSKTTRILLIGALFTGASVGSFSTPSAQAFIFGSENKVNQWIKDSTTIRLRTETNDVRIGSGVGSLFIDTSLGNIGIGTSSPYAKLSVVGEAVAAYYTATTTTASIFPYASTTALTTSGSLFTALTANSVPLIGASGLLTEDTSNFVWDDTNNRLGIGTTSPYAKLSVVGETVAEYFTATSTTATSTFANIKTDSSTMQFESGVADGASAVGYVFDTANSLTTSGAEIFQVKDAGADLFHIEKAGVALHGRMGLGSSGVVPANSVLDITGTMDVTSSVPLGTGLLEIDATLNMVSAIRSAAAFNGKATVTGGGVIPFVSGMLFQVDQQGTGAWGANPRVWSQEPVVIGARITSQTGSANLGNWMSAISTFPPDFQGGYPTGTYNGLQAANYDGTLLGTTNVYGLYIWEQKGTTEGAGIFIRPQGDAGIVLNADSDAGRILLGAGKDADIKYVDTVGLQLTPDLVGTGYVHINTAQTLALTIGKGTAGVDYVLKFDGETNDGTLTWMEDEDRFDFSGSVDISNTLTGATRPLAHLSKTGSASQDIGGANGTIVAISWDNQDNINTAFFTHDTATNNSRITIDTTGRYEIIANVTATTAGAARTTLGLYSRVNGTTNQTKGKGYNYTRGTAYGAIGVRYISELDLTAGDYIEIMSVVDDTDASYVITTNTTENEVIIRLID